MKTPTPTLLALLLAAASPAALAAGNLVVFDGGIGVHPVGRIGTDANGTPIPVANTVRGVSPGGLPWVIESLRASIKTDGTINARGEGLIFSGGNNIGTRGGVRMVAATLFCGTDEGFSSPAVPLDEHGDFEIHDVLSGFPPHPCGDATNPAVLLIRNAQNGQLGAWFAAGIPKD